MLYTLMHKTKPVLLMELDEGTGTIISLNEIFEPERVPPGISFVGDTINRIELNKWWTGRSIPASRSGIRDALEAMQIPSPTMLLTKCYGLSLSDQYWVKPEGMNLNWKDINFFDNAFSEDVGNILFGEIPQSAEFDLMSPDNTSDGWLQKKWKIIDGTRCLIKGGSNPFQQEPLNEVLATSILKRLNVPHTPYTAFWVDGKPYCKCESFITAETELISAYYIALSRKRSNNTSPYQHFINVCEVLGIQGAREALDKMLTVDYIIANGDRHYSNFGAIRNAGTLEWLSLAPVYDCGTSMWFDKIIGERTAAMEVKSKPFRGTQDEQIRLVGDFKWLDFSALRGIDEELREMLKASPFIDETRRDALCFGLRTRIELLLEQVRLREAGLSKPRRTSEFGRE